MDLAKEKIEIIQWILALQDANAIERLKIFKDHPEKTDWWDEISDEEKAAIELGLEDARLGKVKSHDEVKKLYEKWL